MRRRPLEEAAAQLDEALAAVCRHRPEDDLPEHVRLLGIAARAARHARRVEDADILARSLAYYQHRLETAAGHPPPAETSTPPRIRPRAARGRCDPWCEAITAALNNYEKRHKRTPTADELWRTMLRVPPQGYDITVDQSTQVLRMVSRGDRLDRSAFRKRYNRLFTRPEPAANHR